MPKVFGNFARHSPEERQSADPPDGYKREIVTVNQYLNQTTGLYSKADAQNLADDFNRRCVENGFLTNVNAKVDQDGFVQIELIK
jgi:hypothetical protein